MAEEDQKPDVLGEEYGALAGHTPEGGLRIMMGMQSEMAAENQRLRAEAAKPPPLPPEPKKEAPEPSSVDLDVIRGEDKDKAAEELNRHTREIVGEVVKESLSARDEADFPTKREQAKAQAAEMIRKAGGDFSKHEKELDAAMSEAGKVSREAQTNAGYWAQAFVTREGIQAMGGEETKGGAPHVERPTPDGRQTRGKAVLTPVESEVRDNFARVAGEKISDEDWAFFRDKGQGPDEPRMNIDDYEEYVLQQKAKQKGRR